MVEVVILGGKHCRKVVRFEKRLIETASELNMEVHIIKKTTLTEFLTFDTYLLPTILFNGKMIRGWFPTGEELKRFLIDAEKKYKSQNN